MASKTTSYKKSIDLDDSSTYRTEAWTGRWSSHDMTILNGVINKMKDATFTYDKGSNHFVINYNSPPYKENLEKLGFDINTKGSVIKELKMEKQIINNDDLGKILYIEKKLGNANGAIRNTLKMALNTPNIAIKPVPGSAPHASAKMSPPPGSAPQAPAKTGPPPLMSTSAPLMSTSAPLMSASASASAPLMSASASASAPKQEMSTEELIRLQAFAKENKQALAAAKVVADQPLTKEQETARQQEVERKKVIAIAANIRIQANLQKEKEAALNAIPLPEEQRQALLEQAKAKARAAAANKVKPGQPTSETSPMPPAAVLPEGWIKNGEYYFYKSDNINQHIKLPPTPQATFGPPQLPFGWEKKIDTATQVPYYSNAATQSTQWNYPFPPLADGWIAEIDPVSQVPYFINVKNGVVGDAQWDFPGKPVAPVAKKYYKY